MTKLSFEDWKEKNPQDPELKASIMRLTKSTSERSNILLSDIAKIEYDIYCERVGGT